MQKLLLILSVLICFNMPVLAQDPPVSEQITQQVAENPIQTAIPESTHIDENGTLVEQIPESKLKLSLNLPEDLAGYHLFLKDDIGTTVEDVLIDSTGSCEIDLNKNLEQESIMINTTDIKEEPPVILQKYSTKEICIFFILSVLIIFVIGFWIGRFSIMRLIKDLRDDIYEEDLDS